MNNTYTPFGTLSIEAAADLVAKRFIGFDGNYCGAGKKAAGVSESDTDDGDQIPVIASGVALVETGGTFDVGDPITSDADGKAVEASTFSITVPSGSTPVTSDAAQPDLTLAGGVLPQAINGYAMEASTASGQFVQVLIGA